jgi:hypothetical protein
MDHCLCGTSRRVGLPRPRDLRSNTVNRSLKTARVGAIDLRVRQRVARQGMKEPGD